MAKEEEFKFGVSDLAEEVDKSEATVRAWLRRNKIKKAGKGYGWKTKSEVAAKAKEMLKGGGDTKKAAKKTKKVAVKKKRASSGADATAA